MQHSDRIVDPQAHRSPRATTRHNRERHLSQPDGNSRLLPNVTTTIQLSTTVAATVAITVAMTVAAAVAITVAMTVAATIQMTIPTTITTTDVASTVWSLASKSQRLVQNCRQ